MPALSRHLSVLLLALTTSGLAAAGPQAGNSNDVAQFVVILRGVRVGSERVTVTHPDGAFKIEMTGQLTPPLDLVTTKFEMTYGADWQPRQLRIEGALRNETLTIATSFSGATAHSELVQGARRGVATHQVTPGTIVLPANFFGAYEAFAARLATFPVGTRVPVYVAPEGEITATINRVTPRQISSPSGVADLQEYDLTLNRPGAPMSVQVLVDANHRLARVVYRDQAFAAIREEFATVMAREVRVRNPGDEDVFIGASGFNLAATVTRPSGVQGRAPAVILVGGPGRQDRDETLYGVSLFGQLAGRLAEAGYLVVRFDKRGVGQSGGRQEHAGIPEYAEDVVRIVTWLRKRKDVDQDRIAVLTHAEGSAIGITAAAREKKIRALGLLSAPGSTGREVVLDQQEGELSRRNEPADDRQAKIALQRRVIDAVISGNGWETIPPEVRRQADSPFFKSWLLFDPAEALKKVRQPLLILHGSVDAEVPPAAGERLAEAGAARKGVPAAYTNRIVVPRVNHLLIPATSGDPDEYPALSGETLSTDVVAAIVGWLRTSLNK